MHAFRRYRAFTLVEFVIVLALTAVIASVTFLIIAEPLRGYAALERRVRLVDIADTALQRMTREIRLALPYSIRLNGTMTVEFLRTIDGGRYRGQGAGRLNFNVNNDTFTVLGSLSNAGAIDTGTGAGDCIDSDADCLVIYNIQQPATAATATASGFSANAYLGSSAAYEGNIATISAVTASTVTFDNSGIGPPNWSFGISSPQQRFHIVDTPVKYICSGGEINRHSDYDIEALVTTAPAGANAQSSLLVDQVTACNFQFDPPTASRAGILTLNIQITDPASGENVSLLQQIHVSNLP